MTAATVNSSPSLPMTPTVVPTSTSPSATTILSRMPSASASTSWVTLSVSSSYSGSRFATASPSDFSQRTIVPDSIQRVEARIAPGDRAHDSRRAGLTLSVPGAGGPATGSL